MPPATNQRNSPRRAVLIGHCHLREPFVLIIDIMNINISQLYICIFAEISIVPATVAYTEKTMS